MSRTWPSRATGFNGSWAIASAREIRFRSHRTIRRESTDWILLTGRYRTTANLLDDFVQRSAGPHRRGALGVVGPIVAADVYRLTLCREQLRGNLALVLRQRGGYRSEALLQLCVLVLGRERLGPPQRQIERRAAVVDLVHLARGKAAVFEILADRLVERFRQQGCPPVARLRRDEFQRRHERAILAERIPAQMPFLHELLHVLWRRSAGAGLEHLTACEHRHDREHSRARSQFENREQVGE